MASSERQAACTRIGDGQLKCRHPVQIENLQQLAVAVDLHSVIVVNTPHGAIVLEPIIPSEATMPEPTRCLTRVARLQRDVGDQLHGAGVATVWRVALRSCSARSRMRRAPTTRSQGEATKRQ